MQRAAGSAAPAPALRQGYAAGVHAASDLRVVSGANAGDALPLPADSVPGDFYQLATGARVRQLTLDFAPAGHAATGTGPAGRDMHADRRGAAVTLRGSLSLMAPDGDLVEVLVLETPDSGRLALPLAPLRPRLTYTLIAADARPGPIRLADTVAGAFGRGTRIALADGRQLPVEEIEPGTPIITRDHGAQTLRWKGAVRLRAEGGFAPVVVLPGAMGNLGALVVSPHHRLFLYRPDARAVAGAAELLVQARHLVDGRTILRRPGGHVEYFSLVFDRHEVIYAEGLPCESLRLTPATLTRLPEALAEPLRAAFPGLDQRLHTGADVAREIVSRLRDGTEASEPLSPA